RLFLVYGPHQDDRFFIPQLLHSRNSAEPLLMTAGEQTRDFVWVGDAVEVLLQLGLRPDLKGHSFNVCTGQETSIREVVEMVSELCGKWLGGGLGKLTYRPKEIFRIVGNPAALQENLGIRPTTPLRQGLEAIMGGY
ncbi:unnamed protein product, partial [Phaeothamnion confervicola]